MGIFPAGGGTNGDHSRALGLTISDFANTGIRLGWYSAVRNCNVSGLLSGIVLWHHSIADGNQVVLTGELDTQQGIDVQSNGVIRNNIVRDAPGDGIYAGASSVIVGNIVRSSGVSGIVATGNGSIIERNSVVSNQNFGIEVATGTDHLIRGNNVINNNQSAESFTNIEACATCTLTDNHAP